MPRFASTKNEIINYMINNNIDMPYGSSVKNDILKIIKQTDLPVQYPIYEMAKKWS